MDLNQRLSRAVDGLKAILPEVLISFFVILPYLFMFSTYLHEQAHVSAALGQNIIMVYKPPLIDIALPVVKLLGNLASGPFAAGLSSFTSQQDKASYLALGVPQKRAIMMAGITSDLMVLWVILFVLFFLFLISRHGIADRMGTLAKWAVRIASISLLLWAILLVYSTLLNLNTATGDLSFLLYYK